MNHTTLPAELSSYVSGESQDFSVKAGRAQPLKNSLFLLGFGAIWTAGTAGAAIAFFGPLLAGEDVPIEINGVPTVLSADNLGTLWMPASFIGFFVLIGIVLVCTSIYTMLRKGGYFVGTPKRLVHFENGNLRSIDWEQFSGDIKVGGTTEKGNISLQLRTGSMVSNKNGSHYVPEVIYISDVANVWEIEKICRRRIKENDPTPSVGA